MRGLHLSSYDKVIIHAGARLPNGVAALRSPLTPEVTFQTCSISKTNKFIGPLRRWWNYTLLHHKGHTRKGLTFVYIFLWKEVSQYSLRLLWRERVIMLS